MCGYEMVSNQAGKRLSNLMRAVRCGTSNVPHLDPDFDPIDLNHSSLLVLFYEYMLSYAAKTVLKQTSTL